MGHEHMRRGAAVALVLLTVIGMTAAPVLANSPSSGGQDCDLVDVDGDNNKVSVDMANSEVNINCGDGGDAGTGSAADDGGHDADAGDKAVDGDDADDGHEKMTVKVNGDEVDVSDDAEKQDKEKQDAEHQQPEKQDEEVQEPEKQDADADADANADADASADADADADASASADADADADASADADADADADDDGDGAIDEDDETDDADDDDDGNDADNDGDGAADEDDEMDDGDDDADNDGDGATDEDDETDDADDDDDGNDADDDGDGAADEDDESDDADDNVENDEGDQNVENDEGDQNVENDEGDQNVENDEGDQQVGGPGDDVLLTVDELVQLFTQLNFIDQDELNAAINNENVSNSTIVNNVINGDLTINRTSVFVDNSTNIDNSTTLVQIINDNDTTIVFDNDTVINDSDDITIIDDSGDTVINESGPGDVETGPGNETDGNDTDGNVTPPGDMNQTAPDIAVTKSVNDSAVNVTFDETAGLLQAEDPVQFTVTVTNEGNETAQDVVVNDDDVVADIEGIPDETTVFLVLNSSTSQGDFSAVTGDFEVGTLAPGESATLTFDALVVSTNLDLLNGDVASINATNDAILENVDPNDPNGANDRGQATVQLLGLIDLPGPGTDTPAPSPTPSPSPAGETTSVAGFVSGSSTLTAFGTMGVIGLLGGVLLFRRKDE